jgi:hypothetical protein
MKKPLPEKTTTKVIKTPNGGAIVITTVYYDDGSDEKIIVNAKRYMDMSDPENRKLSVGQRLDKMFKNFKKKPDE